MAEIYPCLKDEKHSLAGREAENLENKILNGDCITILKKMPPESVDLIFADPPYWMRVAEVLNRPTGTEYDGCNDEWDNRFVSNED